MGEGSNNEPGTLSGHAINEKTDVSHLDVHTRPTSQAFISGTSSQELKSQPQTPLFDSTVPHTLAFGSYFSERKRKETSGIEMTTPRVVTPVSARGRGFKSSPLPGEMDITDGVKHSGRSNVTREGDGSAQPSETVTQGN